MWLLLLLGCVAEVGYGPGCVEPLEDSPGVVVHWVDVSSPEVRWQVAQPAGAVVWTGELVGEDAALVTWRPQWGAWDVGPIAWRRGEVEGLAGICGVE